MVGAHEGADCLESFGSDDKREIPCERIEFARQAIRAEPPIAEPVALEAHDAAALAGAGSEPYIVGSCQPNFRAFDLNHRFSWVDVPVFVTGETDSGKKLAAKATHDRSTFAKEPFISNDCAGLPASIVEAGSPATSAAPSLAQ